MSTRCHIGFYDKKPATPEKGWKALIYRHSDGYPDGVLPDLLPFLKDFKEHRGITDYEYCAARALQYLTNKYDQEGKEWALEQGYERTHAWDYLGYGISNSVHSDIEYFYAVYPDEVRVFEAGGTWEKKDYKLIKTIAL